jgi:hypothetical protein
VGINNSGVVAGGNADQHASAGRDRYQQPPMLPTAVQAQLL